MNLRGYLKRCRWTADSMAVFVKKHPSVLVEFPNFLEIETGPLCNTECRTLWKQVLVRVLMSNPLTEIMMTFAQSLWCAGMRTFALRLAVFAKRLYFNRFLSVALSNFGAI
jgi:hypothetical protein